MVHAPALEPVPTTESNEPRAAAVHAIHPEPAKQLRAVACVCSYNNGANVARTLEKIPAAHLRDYDVVVINDGSTDSTGAEIAKFDFPVVLHEKNQGVGGAIKSSIRYARDHGYDIVCILAGNNKDDPNEIPKLLEKIRVGGADYVQGSRYASGGSHENTPGFREMMVPIHALVFRAVTGYAGTDALNGFRAYRTSLFDDPNIDIFQDWLDKYELETYLHYQVLKRKYKVVEVGVSKTYPPKQGRKKYSHIRPVIDWWKIMRPLPLLILGLKK